MCRQARTLAASRRTSSSRTPWAMPLPSAWMPPVSVARTRSTGPPPSRRTQRWRTCTSSAWAIGRAPMRLAPSWPMPAMSLPTACHRSPFFTPPPRGLTYSWEIPRLGQFRSYAVDFRRLSTAVTGVANPAATREYLLQTGARNSFLEGRIFEEMLGLAPGAAASAVSVIAAANDQGVALWQLHAGNLQQYLAVTTVSASMQQQVA